MTINEKCPICTNTIDLKKKIFWQRVGPNGEECLICHECSDLATNPYIAGQLKGLSHTWAEYDAEERDMAERYNRITHDTWTACLQNKTGRPLVFSDLETGDIFTFVGFDRECIKLDERLRYTLIETNNKGVVQISGHPDTDQVELVKDD